MPSQRSGCQKSQKRNELHDEAERKVHCNICWSFKTKDLLSAKDEKNKIKLGWIPTSRLCSVGGWNNYTSQWHRVSLVLSQTPLNLEPVDTLVSPEVEENKTLLLRNLQGGEPLSCLESLSLSRAFAFLTGPKVSLLVCLFLSKYQLVPPGVWTPL